MVRRSTTEAYRGWCTLSCIGSMYSSKSSISSASWCTAVCTSSTSASHASQSLLGRVSDPPADNFWTYRATGWVLLPDGLSLWQARRFGTYCQSTWETRPSAETVWENSWKRFCFKRTNAYSALEVLRQCAIQIHITLHYITSFKIIQVHRVWYQSKAHIRLPISD